MNSHGAGMKIVILGLSITSSWGNGHATTYRALVKALAQRGHHVSFLERDVPWYAGQRDLPQPPYCTTCLYGSLEELFATYRSRVREADAVIVGSYVPDGVVVGEWAITEAEGAVLFYDIDTPVTLAKLAAGDSEYISQTLIPRYDAYLTFTGGPVLRELEHEYGAQRAAPLYCAVDPQLYYPTEAKTRWDLGYMGTYSPDRQPALDSLLLEAAAAWPAGRFIVAGPQFPADIRWPENVERCEHLPPTEHRAFYNEQRYTLNITRAAMVQAGYAPSVRLFEAAACGTPIVSDWWPGLDSFFKPGEEILISDRAETTLAHMQVLPEAKRREIGVRARARILQSHTADHRAKTLEGYLKAIRTRSAMTT